MADITNEQVAILYDLAKGKHDGKLSLKQAVDEMANYGMTKSSATSYIRNVIHMFNGELYRRTLNHYATDYFLKKIHQDFGNDSLKKAITALENHIHYFEGLRKVHRKGLWEIVDQYRKKMAYSSEVPHKLYPDELDDDNGTHNEGASKTVQVNKYERSAAARSECLEHYGYTCMVCAVDFAKRYGIIGQNFIHVHHLVELNTIKKNYKVNPKRDLRPVCPNCHAMLHRRKPAFTIDELKRILYENEIG